MKDLILQLEEAGFEFDEYDNRFERRGFQDQFIGVQITENGIEVQVCGVSDEDYVTIGTLQTLEDTFKFIEEEVY